MNIKKNKFYKLPLYAIVCFLFLFISCNDYCNEIINYSKTKYGNGFKEGEIDLKEVYSLKWDTLYIFQPLQYPQEISKEIGFDCECKIVPDGKWLFLFIKENKIIKREYTQCLNVNFVDSHGGKGSYKIVSSNAKFKVNRSESNKNYYLLKNVQ